MKAAHTQQSQSVNALEIYFRDINRTPLLSAEQEKELAARVAQGCIDARNQLVRANLRLVVRLARKYLGRGLSLSDLIEEGNLGLMRAAERFDPSKGTRFSTYASFWIRQGISRALSSFSRTVRIPAYMVTLVSQWRQTESRLRDRLGREPREEEVAAALKASPKKVEHIRSAIAVWNSDAPKDQFGETAMLDELLVDPRCQCPQDRLAHNDRLHRMQDLLGNLDQRDRRILTMRFGLDSDEPRTLKEIGDMMGLSRERVRQIAAEAITRLNQAMLASE